ncbi:LysR family transcriptional regulator [Azospirillum sp. YIM B02556]|uniref:LysR family transcriptional regulator n=1 Tax=Azospirillum endophyticum TaxID=2800326 RepID=A0ABS1FF99_9PROT|nr:LysR family transcriptional regulator [Azospirillum endophyticum]MBK1842067.1 LysR family transcriptional regulator [Azospirillum endophyticum]
MQDLNDTIAFVRVVEEGSFTKAARRLRLPKTTLSRKVRDLERRLGIQLLHRTTRRLGLTEAGTVYFERCRRIAGELEQAESAVAQLRDAPRGWLRITTPPSFGMTVVAPLLPDFRARCPDVRIDLVLSHENLDLVARDIDLAIRMGTLQDSSMAARKLGVLPRHVYAAPSYCAVHGVPAHPDELIRHLTLANMTARRPSGYGWHLFRTSGDGQREEIDVVIDPVMAADDPEMLVPTLLAGGGLVLATDFAMRPYRSAGQVERVLDGWRGSDVDLHAVFPGGRIQPPKVRSFLDFLAGRIDLADAVDQG